MIRRDALERSQKMTRRVLMMLFLGCAMGVPATLTFAQDNANQNRRGNFDPAQFREQMMTRMKEQLGSNDDEWKVLSPKIEKLMTAQRDARVGFGGGGGGQRRGGDTQQNQSATAKASAELRTALENKDTPAPEIAAKLTALREARDKGRAELVAAQKELKEILTQRQEAVLVTMGMLE
jgi:hypothetical protein